MNSYNLRIGICISCVCKFGKIYDVTRKLLSHDGTAYKVMLMLLVQLQTLKLTK